MFAGFGGGRCLRRGLNATVRKLDFSTAMRLLGRV